MPGWAAEVKRLQGIVPVIAWLALGQIRTHGCVFLHLWGRLQTNTKSVAFRNCTKLSPVIKRKEYWVQWERVFLLQCAGSDIGGSACMHPCSLCARFLPDSAADPVELFSSVAFLKNLFVECFHIQKVMFAFLFLCCKKCKQGKQKLFFFFFFKWKGFGNQKRSLSARVVSSYLVLIFHWKRMWEGRADFNKTWKVLTFHSLRAVAVFPCFFCTECCCVELVPNLSSSSCPMDWAAPASQPTGVCPFPLSTSPSLAVPRGKPTWHRSSALG